MNHRRVFAIYLKELLEFVRDRRTFMIMILVPALLYPGMILAMAELSAVQIQKQQSQTYQVGILESHHNHPLIQKIKENPKFTLKTFKKIETKDVDLFLQFEVKDKWQEELKLHYDNTRDRARFALRKVQDIAHDHNKELRKERLTELQVDLRVLNPLIIKDVKLQSKEKEGRYLAGRILPGIMLVMLAVGCSFISQEITAGEKERGTLETILCSPISRLELVIAKYLTVMTIGCFSGLINLASMGLTLSQFRGMGGKETAFSGFSLPWDSLPILILCLIFVSALVAGLCLLAASLAKTVQEAAQYMIPVILMLSLPVLLSSLPGMEMKGAVLLTPFLNFCLLFQEILLGQYNFTHIGAVLISTFAFNGTILFILMKVFNNEAILFNHEGKMTFSLKRSQLKWKDTLETSDSFLLFFFMLAAGYFALSLLPTTKLGFFYGTLTAHWGLFFSTTIALLLFFKVRLKSALSLKAPKITQVIAAILMAPACHILLGLLQVLLKAIGFDIENSQISKAMEEILQQMLNNHGAFGLWFMVAFTAGVCEEVLFRGAILSGLKKAFTEKQCMLIIALMFGAMHFSIFRFPSTAIMGALISFFLLRGQSLFTCIIFHVAFNSIPVLVFISGADPEALEKNYFTETWQQATILLLSAIIVFFGLRFFPKTQAEG